MAQRPEIEAAVAAIAELAPKQADAKARLQKQSDLAQAFHEATYDARAYASDAKSIIVGKQSALDEAMRLAQKLTDSGCPNVGEASCRFLADAVEAQRKIAPLTEEIETLKQQHRAEYDALLKKADAAREAYQASGNPGEELVELDAEEQRLRKLADNLPKLAAYQGTLAIAFGARGSGNAAAHYEPLRTVINLTKMHGAGSLAHEWWHGLDDYLGTKMGAKGMLSEQPRLYAPFQKLIDTMKYKPETPEQAAKRTEAQTERTRKNAASWLDSSVLASLKRYGNEEQMETYAVLREAFLSGEPGSVGQISAFKKNVTGRVIPKSERERLEIFERMLSRMQAQEAPQIGRTETDFYRNSVRMGKECEKDGGYWDSNVEMTARAFACYIKDKLPYTSDYLAGHADCALTLVSGKDGEMEVLKAFPVGEERRAINAVFDEIIQDLKREQLLTHADVTLPLSVSELREAADGQLSMFGVGRPSVMDQLAANRPADKKSPAQTIFRKNHEPEI